VAWIARGTVEEGTWGLAVRSAAAAGAGGYLGGAKLLSEWPAHGADEAGLIVEHCQAKFFGAGGNVDVNRHHHAVIEDLLIGAGVEGPIHFDAAGGQTFATGVKDAGVKVHIHFLLATGVFSGERVRVHKKDDADLAEPR
jgi:hypothetical protein